jgi:hypothetical protein
MIATRLLHFVFTALISLGLAIAPLATSLAVAGDRMDMGMMQMADMSGDMPCCPDKQKQGECQDCLVAAICVAKVLQNAPSSEGLPVRRALSRAIPPLDEPVLAGMTRPPPDHPPRSIV